MGEELCADHAESGELGDRNDGDGHDSLCSLDDQGVAKDNPWIMDSLWHGLFPSMVCYSAPSCLFHCLVFLFPFSVHCLRVALCLLSSFLC